ncbi:MAG: ABC transporter substrate-binding protein [Chloroflexi bacterium]|nr:ABC transporter substrate-binding protein [Chloroflexota bacterium]
MNRLLQRLCALLSLIFVLTACLQPLPAAESARPTPVARPPASAGGSAAGDIVLGMSAAFRGPSAGLGNELYRGSLAYLEQVNRAGGVSGKKITIRAYDDGYNPTPAIQNTMKLVEEDNAFLLFGYVGTPTVTRVLPLLKRYSDKHISLFFPFTGAQPHREPPYDAFVFNLRASYRQETEGLVDRFVAIGRKRIAVFYQADSYGRSGWDGVRRALAKHDLSIAGEATYRRGTPYAQSLRQQVELLRKADADAIISIGAYAACAALVRDARDAGWDVPIANVSFVGSGSLLDVLLETGRARGKDYTANLINSEVVPNYDDTFYPAVREYRESMETYHPMPPSGVAEEGYRPLGYSAVSFEGYLNARAIVEIIKKMGSAVERARIRPVVEGLEYLDVGTASPATFGPQKHQGWDAVYYNTVSEGKWLAIRDWQRWAK